MWMKRRELSVTLLLWIYCRLYSVLGWLCNNLIHIYSTVKKVCPNGSIKYIEPYSAPCILQETWFHVLCCERRKLIEKTLHYGHLVHLIVFRDIMWIECESMSMKTFDKCITKKKSFLSCHERSVVSVMWPNNPAYGEYRVCRMQLHQKSPTMTLSLQTLLFLMCAGFFLFFFFIMFRKSTGKWMQYYYIIPRDQMSLTGDRS